MRWLLAMLVLFAGCGGTPAPVASPPCETTLDWGHGGALMFPGTDCLHCHTMGGRAASHFTVGGTVFSSSACPAPATSATVTLTDANGTQASLEVNEAGNFFTDLALTPPFKVAVEAGGKRVEMKALATGACGMCHKPGIGSPGQISTP